MAEILGWLTFLVAFFWLPWCIFGLEPLIGRTRWYWRLPRKTQDGIPAWAAIVGTAAILLLWYFVLPDWWRAATPAWGYER